METRSRRWRADQLSTVFFMNGEIRYAKWKDRLLWLLGRRVAFRVEGESMLPTIRPGDVVLLESVVEIAVGDLVLAEHPYRSSVRILKRVSKIETDGTFALTGDNPAESTDSRSFGPVSIKSVVGRVVCKLK